MPPSRFAFGSSSVACSTFLIASSGWRISMRILLLRLYVAATSPRELLFSARSRASLHSEVRFTSWK